MKPIKIGLALLALAAMAALAWGQSISPSGLIGAESWVCSVGGPQGPSVFCTTNLMRDTTGYSLISTTTGTVTATQSAVRYIFTAALTGAITLNTPNPPLDGEMLEVVNGTGSAFTSTITVTGTGGQTVLSGALATLAAGGSGEFQYSASTTTWYRLR